MEKPLNQEKRAVALQIMIVRKTALVVPLQAVLVAAPFLVALLVVSLTRLRAKKNQKVVVTLSIKIVNAPAIRAVALIVANLADIQSAIVDLLVLLVVKKNLVQRSTLTAIQTGLDQTLVVALQQVQVVLIVFAIIIAVPKTIVHLMSVALFTPLAVETQLLIVSLQVIDVKLIIFDIFQGSFKCKEPFFDLNAPVKLPDFVV